MFSMSERPLAPVHQRFNEIPTILSDAPAQKPYALLRTRPSSQGGSRSSDVGYRGVGAAPRGSRARGEGDLAASRRWVGRPCWLARGRGCDRASERT